MPGKDETASHERRLVLESDIAGLERLTAFARSVGEEEGLSKDQIFALELCLEEAVANIMMYGGDAEHALTHIWVTMSCVAAFPVVRLEDDGRAFDPTSVPAPAAADSLAHAKVGGLGVHLMRQLTTNIHYERVGERNRLTLEFGPRVKRPDA
jgi:anti-sigma regulatory factor (Ser/Thr protein kinase)